MRNWLIILFAVAINLFIVGCFVLPEVVTYAEVPRESIACGTCSSPEVTAALVQASANGRAQVLGVMAPFWLVALAALANVVLVAGLIVKVQHSNKSMLPTPYRRG